MTDPTPETTPTRDEAVPPGWKLVPVEPTEAMMAVGRTCGTNSANTYRAMLASAPAPASGGVDAVARRAKYLLNRLETDDGLGIGEIDTMLRMAASLSPAATPVSEAEPDWMEAQQVRKRRGVEIMQEYAWGNLTPLGVANHLKRAGFNIDYAQKIANDLAKPASSPAGGDQSLGAMLNHATLTIRGLEERIALYRANYTTNSALDHGRRQIIDDFEKFLHERASLSQSTSAGRVGE